MARVVFFLIGLLLSVTAILKLWMLLTDPFADVRVALSKEILWISLGIDLGIAWLNFRLADRAMLSFINVVVFSVFAIFALIRWGMGYQSCGCTGNLNLPSWLFSFLDFGIVAILAFITFPERLVAKGWCRLYSVWGSWTPARRGQIAGLGLFLVAITAMNLPIGSHVKAAMFGQSKILATVRVDGDLQYGKESVGEVEFWNRSSVPARIVGFSRSCRCFDFREDPVSDVLPANSRFFRALLIRPPKSGLLHQRIEVYLDHPEQFRVRIDLSGFVKGD